MDAFIGALLYFCVEGECAERTCSEIVMDERRKDYYRVFTPNVPNVRMISERLTSEADAKRLKREILMSYPAAIVRILKIDESGGSKT